MSWRTKCIALSVFVLFMMFSAPIVPISAVNDWQEDNPKNMKSLIEKTVNPVFINVDGDPRYRKKESLGIDIGETWKLDYFLEEGKRYHVFLVGDWICNETEPETDYDINTVYPNGVSQWNTESAGLPEQVANDKDHQYFIPPLTGTYRFKIINDERDSKNTEGAIFMLLEHIDVNTEYSQDLEGRDDEGQEVLFSGWAYEFDTAAPRIRVFVDVPDSLDMYEARLYMMANPDSGIGYEINGLGVPTGDLFIRFQGQYGGFSTSCKGDRNIDAMASCEHSGKDMEFVYDTPNSYNDTGVIFYYIVLIAEHNEGTVGFYAQTDFSPPIVTLIEPPEIGYMGEETKIEASVEDDTEIKRVWVEYCVGATKTLSTIECKLRDSTWVGTLPHFNGDYVEYTVYAEDKFGNTGSTTSEFLVKKKTSIECDIADMILVGDEKAEISGRTSLSSATLTLTLTNRDTNHVYNVKTDENGDFEFIFTPEKTGEWKLQASFEGSETEVSATSDIITFTMESKPTHISNMLSANRVKMNVPVVVYGSVSPGVAGLPVQITFVSSSSSHTETAYTAGDGSFSCNFEPPETGTWNVLSKVGDGLYYSVSQSKLSDFVVVPLNMFDKTLIVCYMLLAPPYLYGTAGLLGASVFLILYKKRDVLAPLLPKSRVKKVEKGKSNSKKQGQRYRRAKK